MKEILRENGKAKAVLEQGSYGANLLTMCNGYQWTGQPMTHELARLTIEVLQDWLDNGFNTQE